MESNTNPALQEPVHDSPTGWVKQHIDEYVDTEGAEGKRWNGTDILLLTTRGRRSDKLRRTALIYGKDGSSYVVVASKGGAPKHPAWYLNLSANPTVWLQVGADTFRGTARTATGTERTRLWEQMAAIWPAYNDYQEKTDREIPIVVIEVPGSE